MLKFRNNHIFTGYLKQLLASFNLPKYKIYTKEQQKFFEATGAEKNVIPTIIPQNNNYPEDLRYIPYIKNNKIQHYIKKPNGGCWENTPLHYHKNKWELNYTKTFQIKNNIYDNYTHEYLGDFLRFLRDYYNLDLMPLYNCFGDRIVSNLKLKKEIKLNNAPYNIEFLSTDSNYKIYMLPVKLFKEYTIALDCNETVELCCGFYNSYLSEDSKLQPIYTLSYMKVAGTKFNKPFIYNKLMEDQLLSSNLTTEEITSYVKFLGEAAQKESSLKLFIKIPINNSSSITVLEGNYLGMNDRGRTEKGIYQNHSVINFAPVTLSSNEIQLSKSSTTQWIPNTPVDLKNCNIKLVTNLQLLKLNTGTSYPFADKLVEYLSGNVITNLETISDNIVRAQKVLHNNKGTGVVYTAEYEGIWDDTIRYFVYDYLVNPENKNNKKFDINKCHDLLGYIDNIAETNIVKTVNGSKVSISRADIYTELYNNKFVENKTLIK